MPAVAQATVDAIGIGVQKSATSWLFRCLVEHPDLRGSILEESDKELNFFNHHWEKGFDWYEGHFRVGPWRNLEFSTLYFPDRNVPERIRGYNPEVRLILCLRNPVERAISQHRHEIRRGRVDGERVDFWEAARRNPAYVEQGLYAAHMERWLEHFDLDRFHVIEYDRVRAEPDGVLRDAFAFLDVAPGFEPSTTEERVNVSRVHGNGPIRAALSMGVSGARFVLGERLTRRIGASPLGAPIQGHRYVEVERRAILPEGSEERHRVAELFRPDLVRLGVLLGRDFSHWT